MVQGLRKECLGIGIYRADSLKFSPAVVLENVSRPLIAKRAAGVTLLSSSMSCHRQRPLPLPCPYPKLPSSMDCRAVLTLVQRLVFD